ncbi:MAG: ABC transporter permease [Rhodothermaceae bacterium]
MIKHLFKLMWNRKRSTALLFVEIFLSFLVLFGVFSTIYYKYSHLSKPTGFNYKNIWDVTLNWKSEETKSIQEKLKLLVPALKNFNEIEIASLATDNSTPYSESQWINSYKNEQDESIGANVNYLDDNFAEVLSLNVTDGRWFNKTEDAATKIPVIINKMMQEKFFKNAPAVGKSIYHRNEKNEIVKEYKVIGVVQAYRYGGEFEETMPVMIHRINLEKEIKDIYPYRKLMLKMKPGTTIAFEEKLVKFLTNITDGWEINVTTVEEKRNAVIKSNILQILFPSVLAFFLILNVGFGLMGVLWYSINRRKSEIGLRIAIGANNKNIYEQIIGEALLLGTFAIVVGIAFALQVPILKLFKIEFVIYLISIATSSIFLYCLVTVCSFYPGMLASKIQPVDALHNE